MTNEHEQQDQPQNNPVVTPSEKGADQSRRQFTRAGLIAAPVIMTLASRPALGYYQCTLSGLLSGNLSNINANTACAGISPGYWKRPQHFDDWPVPTDTPFHPLFAGAPKYAGKSLLQVMNLEGGTDIYDGNIDAHKLAFHAIAAYLTARSVEINPVGPQGVTMESWGMSSAQVLELYATYWSSKPLELQNLFDAWDHAKDRASAVQALFG